MPFKLLCLSICCIYCFTQCNNKQEAIHPLEEAITESVYATGIIKSKNQYLVFSSVNGLVSEILVTEGDIVSKGKPIIRISNTTAQLNSENAAIAAEYASSSYNKDKIYELETIVDQANAKMNNDASLLEKQKNLWAQGIGTKNDLDQKQLAFTTSTKNYEAAKLRVKEMQKQISLQEKQSQKILQINQQVAKEFTIKSEHDGKLYSLLKEKGEMVNTQSPVAIIGDASAFMLELQVDEYDIHRVKTGQKVFVTMDSYKGKVFDATVTKINPIMNPQSKSFLVEAEFDSIPETLFPNLTTEANIVIETKNKALTIPRNYLSEDGYVLNKDKKEIKVITGLKDYKKVEIISGITAADEIIKPLP